MAQVESTRERLAPEMDIIAPLFVPADRPERVRKARERGARTAVIDVEDAPIDAKPRRAREALVQAVTEGFAGGSHLVRVNAVSEGRLLDEDIYSLAGVLGHIDGFIFAKTNSADNVAYLGERVEREGCIPIIPMVEEGHGGA